MSDKIVPEKAVQEALASLQNIVKGHSSRGTVTTQVDSMRDGGVGTDSSAGATQVFHTPSNSDPKSWAGSVARSVPEDGASDAIQSDGTDYKGGAQMMKSILEKLSKGLPLSAKEAAVYSSIAKGDFKFGKEEEDDKKAEKALPNMKDEDKEDTKDVSKSLADHAAETPDVQKGLELSPFLQSWVNTQAQALSSTESRIVSNLAKSINEANAKQESFNFELAKSLQALGEALALQAQRIEQVESTPARGPKSNVVPINKSFGPGGNGEETLSKSQVLDTMVEMVKANKIRREEVIKFETSSTLSPQLEQQVRAFRQAR